MHGELNKDLNENQEEKKSKINVIRMAKRTSQAPQSLLNAPGTLSSFNIKK